MENNIRSDDYWLTLAGVILGRNILPQSTFKQLFKLPPALVEVLFNLLVRSYSFCRPKHLLWSLHYLKTTTVGENLIAVNLRTNKKSLRQYVIQTLTLLERVLPKVCHIY